MGSLLFVLVLLVGAIVAYASTDLRGAKDVRELFAPVVRVVRKEAADQLPKLREKTRQAMDKAVDVLADDGAQPPPAPCPPGTQRVAPPLGEQAAQAGSAEHRPNESVCVDENLVSEVDYHGCAVCEQPKPRAVRVKKGQKRRSGFCLDGRSPSNRPVRCVSWNQANIYCAARAASLPTQNELRAVAAEAMPAPFEWASPRPETNANKRAPFRCVHGR